MEASVKIGKKPGTRSPEEIRIAVIEDDPMYRQAIEHQLKRNPGTRLFLFDSGEECFRNYHRFDPEILILDYRLDDVHEAGKMDGLDVLRQVKSVNPETEIIFLSGQENMDIATAAIKGGASEYIVKDGKALARLQSEVNRISFYIRLKREELKSAKWILSMISGLLLVLLFTYVSGYFPLPVAAGILAAAAGAGLVVFLALRKQKKKSRSPEFSPMPGEGDRPGIWHD